MSQPYNNSYKFKLTLLEDTHIGTGVGNGLVDSFNTRDDQGYPIIWRQHLKGILREAAFDWAHFTGKDEDLNTVNALFGAERENLSQGCLIVYSAELSEDDKQLRSPESFFIELSSTALGKQAGSEENKMSEARSLYNRAAQDTSLRTKQYMRANITFQCGYQFFGVSGSIIETYQQAMLCILQRMYALGSQKHRATGAIKLTQPEPLAAVSNQTSNLSFEGGTLLNLRLEALEPLRLPSTNKPGNVVPTDTFIDGNKMLGALANWCKQHGKKNLFDKLVSGEIGVGYAYPTASADAQICFPLPQHFSSIKVGDEQLSESRASNPSGSDKPWWLGSDKVLPQLDVHFTTPRQGNNNAPNQPKLKKVGAGHYVSLATNKADNWTLLKQKTAVHMRNGLTNRATKKEDANLFTEEVLPKGTQFICQLHIPNETLFNEVNEELLAELFKGQHLLVGRGSAPVKLLKAETAAIPKMPEIGADTKSVTLVATSPWLVYDDDLQPYSKLSVEMLAKVLNLSCDSITDEYVFKRSSVTDITGFNPASGLPKRPEQAIAGGSVLHINWNKLTDEQKKQATLLLQELVAKPAIGQRQAQGLGRFHLYLNVPTLAWESSGSAKNASQSSPYSSFYSNTEKLYEQAEVFWGEINQDSLNSVSKQQWQQLRQKLRRLEYEHASGSGSTSVIADLFNKFTRREIHNNAWLKVKDVFKLWEKEILRLRFEDQITFSLYFFDKIWLYITADKKQVNDKEAAK